MLAHYALDIFAAIWQQLHEEGICRKRGSEDYDRCRADWFAAEPVPEIEQFIREWIPR